MNIIQWTLLMMKQSNYWKSLLNAWTDDFTFTKLIIKLVNDGKLELLNSITTRM